MDSDYRRHEDVIMTTGRTSVATQCAILSVLRVLVPLLAAGFRSPKHHTKRKQMDLGSLQIGALINAALNPLRKSSSRESTI